MNMKQHYLTQQKIERYRQYLYEEEHSPATIEKYMRCVNRFTQWLASRAVTKEIVLSWKQGQIAKGYAASTINANISALNGMFRAFGWYGLHIRFLRVQRRIFREPERELTPAEYRRLCKAARQTGREQTALLMETLAVTGIRVSEMKYITVENVQQGRADIQLKGKRRSILLPVRLCERLLYYAKKCSITQGAIFQNTRGKPMERQRIWRKMKDVCTLADVASKHVFPHNFRHFFAAAYYKAYHDIVKLADILGHSSIETTRIYLLTAGAEHQRQLDKLCLLN